MGEAFKLGYDKWNFLMRIIIWCFNRLQTKDKVDLICKFILFAQESEECQEAVYISCADCPGNIPKGKGMRALGFKEK